MQFSLPQAITAYSSAQRRGTNARNRATGAGRGLAVALVRAMFGGPMRFSPSLALASLLFVFGCADNGSKLRATGTGDLSNPRAPRQAPDRDLVAACGEGGL